MRRGYKILAAIAAIVVLGTAATVMVLDRKYEFLFPAGRVPHEQLASPDMGVRVSIQPAFASDYLLQLLKQQQDVPEWAFARILPYEIAFVLEPKGDRIESTFYVNAQRFGPQIVSYIRDTRLASRISLVQWNAAEPEWRDRGILVLQGTLPIDANAQAIAAGAWSRSAAQAPLILEGNHFVEAAIDNRSGDGFVTILSLLTANGVPDAQLDRASYEQLTHTIAEVRLTADVVDTNEVDITLRLVCDPNTYQEMAGAIDFLYPALYAQVQQLLADTYGAELDGTIGWQNNVKVGHYRLKHLDRLLGLAR